MNIGEMIRSKRVELNMTQQQLADKVFVTRQTISKWELGKSEPDLISLKILEQVLEISFAEEPSVQNEGSNSNMKIRYKLFGMVGFGILFFPFRFLWIKIHDNWNNPLVRLVLIPILLSCYLWYMHSLRLNVFYLFSSVTLIIYLVTSFYFYNSGDGKDEKNQLS